MQKVAQSLVLTGQKKKVADTRSALGQPKGQSRRASMRTSSKRASQLRKDLENAAAAIPGAAPPGIPKPGKPRKESAESGFSPQSKSLSTYLSFLIFSFGF